MLAPSTPGSKGLSVVSACLNGADDAGHVRRERTVDIFFLVVILPVTIGALLIVVVKQFTMSHDKDKAPRLSRGESRFLWISLVFNVVALVSINLYRLLR
jgi:uncharacterized BrkB/YihY/UPF0761 family membrane protein